MHHITFAALLRQGSLMYCTVGIVQQCPALLYRQNAECPPSLHCHAMPCHAKGSTHACVRQVRVGDYKK